MYKRSRLCRVLLIDNGSGGRTVTGDVDRDRTEELGVEVQYFPGEGTLEGIFSYSL